MGSLVPAMKIYRNCDRLFNAIGVDFERKLIVDFPTSSRLQKLSVDFRQKN